MITIKYGNTFFGYHDAAKLRISDAMATAVTLLAKASCRSITSSKPTPELIFARSTRLSSTLTSRSSKRLQRRTWRPQVPPAVTKERPWLPYPAVIRERLKPSDLSICPQAVPIIRAFVYFYWSPYFFSPSRNVLCEGLFKRAVCSFRFPVADLYYDDSLHAILA